MLTYTLILACTLYAATSLADTAFRVQFSSSFDALPTLTLPYGTWRAITYDSADDVGLTILALI